jgi:1-acyl-sn-glycerol-3-phosphate acyltransferase
VKRASANAELVHEPDFLDGMLPWMERFARYFDAEVEGIEALPAGPVLLVGNHSGGVLTPDTTALLAAWYRTRGTQQTLSVLGLDAAFTVPGLGRMMRKLGCIPGTHHGAEAAFERGASVVVYPGGAEDVFRPFKHRNRIDLEGRTGFLRLALRAGVPVVPVVAHGGHHTLMVLRRGTRISRALGMADLGVKVFPLVVQAPWGLSPGGVPMLPLPAKIRVVVGEPMPWSHLGPEHADDREVLGACYDEITARMQTTLDALAAANPTPLRTRLRSAFGRAS